MDRGDQSFRLDEQFEAQVQRTPHNVALRDNGKSITFAGLKAEADRLAGILRNRGVRDGSVVGLHMERSIPYVVSVLAILKANAAVVPLPPSYPSRRLRDILSFAALDAAIDDGDTPLGTMPSDNVIHFPGAADDASGAPTLAPGGPDQPAFVLCSSGSTGTPKMIVRSHRSFFHRLQWTWEKLSYAPGEVCCQKAHMTTTHAIYELFEPLLRGITVCIVSDRDVTDLERFWEIMAAQSISRLLIVPSMLQASLDMPGFKAPALKVLVLMGEYVNPRLAARTVEFFPARTEIFSIYGSTEASSTFVCDVRRSLQAGEELPLGEPLSPDVRAYLMDADLEQVAPGEVGMLYIAGSPLFTEYFRDPALTAAAFVAAPNGEARLYETHDQLRRSSRGELRFVGRVDDTVKIRGYRVDLHEVESSILLHPDVRQCAVVRSETARGTFMLVAFVAPATIAQASVYQVVREHLPGYMVPSAVVGVDVFPLTASGKVDRQKLLQEYAGRAPGGTPGRPQSETERTVSEVWREVLAHASFQPDSNFFEIGGTSLTVFAAVHRLRNAFKLDRSQLSGPSIYQFPTVESLASHIDALRGGSAPVVAADNSILVTLKRGGDAALPPLFVISPAGGALGPYEKVVKALRTSRDVIGVRDPFLWGDRDPTLGFQHWVSRYVSAITARDPQGPYYLLAYSSAGAFAYEIARRLRREGRKVALLALVDPLAMDRATKRRFGYWALQARFERRLFVWLVRLAGWLRMATPARTGHDEQAELTHEGALTNAQYLQFADEVRTNRDHILRFSALLELNTGLPFALTQPELDRVEPSGYVDVLLERVRSVAPDVEPEAIENMVVQYELQVRSQHRYQLRPYDGPVVLFDPAGPYEGLLAAQLRPFVRYLRVRVLRPGAISERTRALAESFPARIRSHYLSMRDDTFAQALADEMEPMLR